jgi:hypothetical protein
MPCAVVGGVALGAHGVARATLDTDVLVANASVLVRAFWRGLRGVGAAEIRAGDADDPLAGVVRFATEAGCVEVVVGRGAWVRRVLERRMTLRVRRRALPVVDRADLVLLKLFAAGPQDLLDVRLLLAVDETGELRQTVEARLPEVPAVVRRQWRRLGAT